MAVPTLQRDVALLALTRVSYSRPVTAVTYTWKNDICPTWRAAILSSVGVDANRLTNGSGRHRAGSVEH